MATLDEQSLSNEQSIVVNEQSDENNTDNQQVDEPMEDDNDVADIVDEPQIEMSFLDKLKDVTKRAEDSQRQFKSEIDALINESNSELDNNNLSLLSKLYNWSNYMSPLVQTFAEFDCFRITDYVKLHESTFDREYKERKESLTKLEDIINTSIKVEHDNEMLRLKLTTFENEVDKLKNDNEVLKNLCQEKDDRYEQQAIKHREDFDTFQDRMASFDEKTVEDYIQKRFPVASNMVSMLISGVTPMQIHNMYLKEKQNSSLLKLDLETAQRTIKELQDKLENYKNYSGIFHPNYPQMSDFHIKTLECKLAQMNAAKIEQDQVHRKELEAKQNEINVLKEELSKSQEEHENLEKRFTNSEKELSKIKIEKEEQQKELSELHEKVETLQKEENNLKIQLNCEKSLKPVSPVTNENDLKNDYKSIIDSYLQRNEELDKQNLQYIQLTCKQMKEIQDLKDKLKNITQLITIERHEWNNKLMFAGYEEDINQKIKTLLEKNRFLYFASHFKFHEFVSNILTQLNVEPVTDENKEAIYQEFVKMKTSISQMKNIDTTKLPKVVFRTTPEHQHWITEQKNVLTNILSNQDTILKNCQECLENFDSSKNNDIDTSMMNTDHKNEHPTNKENEQYNIIIQLKNNINQLENKVLELNKDKIEIIKSSFNRSNVFLEQSQKWKNKYLNELLNQENFHKSILMKDNYDEKMKLLVLKYENIIKFYNENFENTQVDIKEFIEKIKDELHNFRILFQIMKDNSQDAINSSDLFSINEKLMKIENLLSLLRYGTVLDCNKDTENSIDTQNKEKIEHDIRHEVQKEIIKLKQDLVAKNNEFNVLNAENEKIKTSKTELDTKMQQIRNLARKYRDEAEVLKGKIQSLETKLDLEEKKNTEQQQKQLKIIENQKKIIVEHQTRIQKEESDKNRIKAELESKNQELQTKNETEKKVDPPVVPQQQQQNVRSVPNQAQNSVPNPLLIRPAFSQSPKKNFAPQQRFQLQQQQRQKQQQNRFQQSFQKQKLQQPPVTSAATSELASSSSSSSTTSTTSATLSSSSLPQNDSTQKRPFTAVAENNSAQSDNQEINKKPRIIWGKASTSGTVSSSQNSTEQSATAAALKHQQIVFSNNDTKQKVIPPSRQPISFPKPAEENLIAQPPKDPQPTQNFRPPIRGRGGRPKLIRRNIPM